MEPFDPSIQDFLAGRLWLRAHTPFSPKMIDAHIEAGHIKIVPGVVASKGKVSRKRYFCNRCENDQPYRFTTFECVKCEGACTYCRNCLKMGRVSSCSELITWTGPAPNYPTAHTMAWEGMLTPLQQRASDELTKSTEAGRPHLVHAVCGAGKTEILFEPIHRLLLLGKRVCIAAPRVDVILELEPRLRAAFPDTMIEALYGGAETAYKPSQLVLATTHQLYRFRQAFDTIFVDEADAFPYTADETLRKAVQKAAKKNAPIHAVTATPSDALIALTKRNGAISTINRRYHGYPLPVPRYASLWRYEKQLQKGKLPQKLEAWTKERLQQKQPFLIFFHHIALMNTALPYFQQLDNRIQAVHAAHPDRKQFVQALRKEEVPGLLTTTILERGITIPNVQVAVIGAEQRIFNKGALIQIGGRVGRSSQFPTGDFVLFHHGITYAMDEAKREIHRLNKGGVRDE
ncbi:DEAD/DEAH box helicase [Sporosarcina sp. HYO08]|uniref:DEAD/DEAH box helicase n=1 Tax=Sporosarcina sp. HYO08 TaxID=1759557 RepID=UPI00079773F8|nr:DEAD/DEAH box helicase family protein [Sporosarcina sp. HYO08]KXH84133.1 competence protein [Sporosarcina sp. HYO08]